jgi:hypothetical protein
MSVQDLRFRCTAHHEAGHIAIAAVQGLKLRPDGFATDTFGEGLACYSKKPEDSDLSRERIIIAHFAGYRAQERFCLIQACLNPDVDREILSCDWREHVSCYRASQAATRGPIPFRRFKLYWKFARESWWNRTGRRSKHLRKR